MKALKILKEYLSFGNKVEKVPKDGFDWKSITREDIHSFKGEYCFRDYLNERYKNNNTKNDILRELERFFEEKIIEEAMISGEFFSNPVKRRWDRFKTTTKSGTTRNIISQDNIIKLRKILLEKILKGGGNPSEKIMLFLMLNYPLRSMQVRFLDSGRENKKESFLQKIYFNGVSREKRFCVYINTNKSGAGYYIPYVSEEVLKVLSIQYNWIKDNHRDIVIYKEYKNKECKKINPLFLTDKGMIVSRNSLMKLWKNLLKELNEREGIEIDSDLHSLRVSIITNGMNNGFDLKEIAKDYSGQDSKMVNHYYRVDDLRSIVDSKSKVKLLEDKNEK